MPVSPFATRAPEQGLSGKLSGAGSLRRRIDGGGDLVLGNNGDDTPRSYAGDDTLLGEEGNDYLSDTSGSNIFDGGTGDDHIVTGQDGSLTGGEGADTFEAAIDTYAAPAVAENATDDTATDTATDMASYPTVEDFNADEDTIVLSGVSEGSVVETQDLASGDGANVLVDGDVVMEVMGGAGLSADQIVVEYA